MLADLLHKSARPKYCGGSFTFILVLLFLPASWTNAQASPVQTFWVGGTGVWSDSANWSNGVPIAGYQAVLNGGAATLDVISPVLDSVGICTGASCTGASLTVNSTLSADSMQSFGGLTINPGAILKAGTISSLTGFVQETPAITVVNTGGQFLDAGWYSQGGGSTTVNGLLTTALINITGGSITTGSGGIIDVASGGYTQGGSASNTIDSGGQLNVTGTYGQGSGTTSVAGLLGASQFAFTGGSVSVSKGGAIDVGSGGYSEGAEGGPGTITTIENGAQISIIGGDYSQEIGTTTIDDGLLFADQVNNSGTFGGDGTVSASFTGRGSLDPGTDGLGTLTIVGDYTQTGFLDSRFDGLDPSLGNFLAVDGDAVLGGTLDVTFGGGFTPQIGDIFPVMSFDSYSGSFYNVTGENLASGELLKAIYGATGVSVTVVAGATEVPEPCSFGMVALTLLSWWGLSRSFRVRGLLHGGPRRW